MPQQTDKWIQYADPAPATTQPVDRWARYADRVPTTAPESEPDTPATPQTPPDIDYDAMAQALANSKVLGMAASSAYHDKDLIREQLKKRDVVLPPTMQGIANDIKVGAEGSIFGLTYRQKLPEPIQGPGLIDKFIVGASQMVADLPVYLASQQIGSVAGGLAGSEFPVVGNVAGAAFGGSVGTFAIPAAMRESLVQAIEKGDVKSFGDLMDRTLSVAEAGMKGAITGPFVSWAGGATVPVGNKSLETMMKLGQQSAVLGALPPLMEGHIPDAADFGVSTALLLAMHFTVGGIEKAAELAPKVHSRVLGEYAKSGAHPASIASEALHRAQAEPTEDVIDRINELSREAAPTEQPKDADKESAKEPVEKVEAPDLPPASLRPAIKDAEGNVTVGGEGEYHPDIEERKPETKDGERGFADRNDEFRTREEAKAKLRQEEPEVYKHWEREAGGPDEEFHTTDYNEALRKSTGVKNAAVDVQREQRGLPPLESDAPTTRDAIYGQAKADVDSGKVDPLVIAESVNKSPRGLSDSETDALNYYNRQLSDQHKATMDAVEKARTEDNPQAANAAMERLQDIERKQDEVEQAVRKAGTQQGRAFRARQDMIKEDYSLDRVLQRARVASKTGEISPDVRDQLEQLTRDFKEANDRLEAYQSRRSNQEGQRTVDKIKEEVARTQRGEVRKQDRIALDNEFDGLLKQFDSLAGRMSANAFLDPELLGVVAKMARNRVASGLTRFEDIRDYIHEQLTDIGHEFTKREVADAISGYGRKFEMSKDAISVALREAKRQGKLISALEDAQAAVLPLKSGLQRDAVTERVRDLTKQVKQAMRESGIDVKPTQTPEQQWKSALDSVKTRLRNQITDLTKQLQTGEKPAARGGVPLDKEAQALKDAADNLRIKIKQEAVDTRLRLREALQAVEGKPGRSPEQKLKAATDAVERSVSELERKIRENDLTPQQRRSGRAQTPELLALRDHRDALLGTLHEMREAAKPKKAPEEAALDRYKTQLQNRIDDMERQLLTDDFSKEPRKPLVLDKEATDLKVKAERTRQKVDDAIAKQKREARSTTEKVVDTATKWRRAALLTGWSTLGKLTKAAMDRMGVTPIEELLGGVLSHIPGISEIAARAPMHGKPSLSAEVEAVSQLWQKATAADMWSELKTGHDSLDMLFGGKAALPSEVLGLFGQFHGALKVPEKRAEFFRRFEIGMEFAKKNNLDVNDPRVQSAVGMRAYLESQRAILMQPNVLTNAYSVTLAYLHNGGTLGRTLETGARFIFPMVRVATNLPGEALTYTPPALLVRGAQIFGVLADKDRMGKSAFDNLSLHDMDNIMRGLKKGSVGLALAAIGFAFRKNITGYYLTEQEKKQGIKRGVMKIGGTTIPAYLNDTPPLIAIQLTATVGRVWDHYNMKGMSGGLIAGAVQAAQELGKRVPFYGEVARAGDETRTPEQSMVTAGGFAGSLIIPRLISEIAEAMDSAKKRTARTFSDAIKLQIPGLRETVSPLGHRHGARHQP